jgi:hypothetical protein
MFEQDSKSATMAEATIETNDAAICCQILVHPYSDVVSCFF